MNGLLLRWLVNACALALTSALVAGIHVDGVASLLVAALVLGIFNAILRPVLLLVTLPINIVTLGLFTFVINAAMLKLTASVVGGFHVNGFWPALIGALLLSLFSVLLNLFVSDRGRIEYVYVGRRRW